MRFEEEESEFTENERRLLVDDVLEIAAASTVYAGNKTI